jgi:glycosyltransferase 2 family protein
VLNHRSWKRHLILAGKIGLAVGLLVWLVLSNRLQLGRLTSISLDWRLAVLFALVAGPMILSAFRWWWLLRIQGLNEPIGKIVSLTWAGYLAALVLPGAAGGDLARSYLILRRHNQTRARAFSTVLADRFLGIHSLFCLGALSAVWLLAHNMTGSAILTMTALTLGPLLAMTTGLIALLCAPSRSVLFRILPASWRVAWDQSFILYREAVPRLLGCFALSLASSTMAVMSFAVAGQLLGDAANWADSFLAGPLIVVANCLPITPGGIGLAEAVSNQLYSGLGSSGGAELMILIRACGFALSLPGIIPFVTLLRSARMPEKQEDETMAGADCRTTESAGNSDGKELMGCHCSRYLT